jgi:hypothetical protein
VNNADHQRPERQGDGLRRSNPPPRIPQALESIDPRTFLTRYQLSDALEACGIPISYDTLATKASLAVHRSEDLASRLKWAEVVAWVRETMGEPASTMAEHREQLKLSASQKSAPEKLARETMGEPASTMAEHREQLKLSASQKPATEKLAAGASGRA